MANSKLLYSTNTYLAYQISHNYFGDTHYVYCTSDFGCPGLTSRLESNPATSSPFKIYWDLQTAVNDGDRHNAKIASNRIGLREGANAMFAAGIISEAQRDEILAIVERAETRDFKPLIYIMAYDVVKDLLTPVPIEEKAHPLSEEYIIPSLSGDLFEVISCHEL